MTPLFFWTMGTSRNFALSIMTNKAKYFKINRWLAGVRTVAGQCFFRAAASHLHKALRGRLKQNVAESGGMAISDLFFPSAGKSGHTKWERLW
jgi:hypothetical protein